MSRATTPSSAADEKHIQHPDHDAHLSDHHETLRDAAQPPFVAEYASSHEDIEDAPSGGRGDADLEKVASRPSVNNISSVPNGGLVAWLQVVSSFFIFFNTWGIVNTYGAYQTYYEVGILSDYTPSTIAWIGSLQATLLLLVGPLTGPIYDAGHVRFLVAFGSVLTVFGQMMLSLSTKYYQVLLSQAVCIGLGTACMFIAGLAVLSTYFSTRIATAIGIAAAGSSLGGIIYPIVFYRLEASVGFAWATRVIGFIMMGTLIISNAFIRVRVLPAGKRKLIDMTAWKEVPYSLYVAGSLVGFVGLYTPFFYIQSYAINTGLAAPGLAFYLLAVINAASTFGRIIPNYLADKIGPFNVLIPCTFATGIVCLCLIPTRSIASVIVLAALYGFTSGTFVSLPGSIFVSITSNRGLIGTRMGMGFAVISIGVLIGTPITGAILEASSYTYVWLFGGLMTMISGVLILAARVSQGGWNLMTKV